MADDREPWQAWITRYGPAALLYARQLTRSAADAEDAVQEGFIRFWARRRSARDVRAFFFACVRSAALDRQRAEKRRQRREVARSRDWPLFDRSGEEDAARREVVERALEQLPIEQREAVVLKVWGGLTFAQIGDALKESPNTVAARYRYALEKLAGLLTPEESHE